MPAQEIAPAEPLPTGAFKRLGTTRLRHGSRIQSLSFSPDSKFVAAGGGNDLARVWNIQTGARQSFKEYWVNALAFLPKTSQIVTAGAFKKIRLWDVETGAEKAVFEGHQVPVNALAVSADGTIASGSQDGMVILWKPAAIRLPVFLKGHWRK